MDHLDVPWVRFVLWGMRVDLTFPPFQVIIVSTLDFDLSEILLRVRFVPLTIGQSKILLRVRSIPQTTG